MRLEELVAYLDEYLNVPSSPDYPGAVNGLQVESRGDVTRVAVAVDAAQAVIDGAVAAGANLLIVHHGLFWDGNIPVTGRRYRRIRALLDADLALYSSHLPLDAHPEVGNNAVLARELGIEVAGPLGEYKGLPLGIWGTLDVSREALAARLDETLGCRIKLVAGGPERVCRVGIVTGGAGDQVSAARALGLDAFITGEGA
ncbi:MAG: Nif3-like dinuclear metal center hexameric protein, partial [Gemmatimonadetes bacterium]|nr:Nif3-like dinuclear metal center hexameric protein [Gemmatimonadota bacterium]